MKTYCVMGIRAGEKGLRQIVAQGLTTREIVDSVMVAAVSKGWGNLVVRVDDESNEERE